MRYCCHFQVSSCSDWYYTGLSRGLTFSQATASRLSQPLIGVCTLPHTSHPQKGFTVFQMSAAGDLFYQPFYSQDSRGSEEGQFNTQQGQGLDAKAKILCQKWIDMIDRGMDDAVKTTSSQSDFVEVEKRGLGQPLLSLPMPHPHCVLCNDIRNEELDHTKGDSSICERCGLDVSYSSKLVEHQKTNRVLTRSSLGIQDEVKDLGIFPVSNKAADPLSKSLLVNWNSDEPIPVFSNEPIQLSNDGPIPQGFNDGLTPVHSDEPIQMKPDEPVPASSVGTVQVNSDKAVNSDKPVLVNSKEPMLVQSNRPILVRNKEAMLDFVSTQQEEENQHVEDRTKAHVIFPSQDYSLSPSDRLPADKIPTKRAAQSASQIQVVKNSPKKKKRTVHMMGF